MLSKENKKLLLYIGSLFLAVLLTYRLPHKSYSIIQYIIPPIKTGSGGAVYLAGIVPLILFVIGVKGLFGLERFEDNSKLGMFFIIIIIVIPLMNWAIDVSRTNYHWIKDDGLKAIDIEESNIGLSGSDEETVMNISLELKDYGRKENNFKIRVYLPESLRNYSGKEFLDLEDHYFTHGRRNTYNVEEDIVIKLGSNEDEIRELFRSDYHLDDVVYELYNRQERITIIQNGM